LKECVCPGPIDKQQASHSVLLSDNMDTELEYEWMDTFGEDRRTIVMVSILSVSVGNFRLAHSTSSRRALTGRKRRQLRAIRASE
jgi:hypothetical protein